MGKGKNVNATKTKKGTGEKGRSKALVARRDVQDAFEFKNLMSALTSDVLLGHVSPVVANAAVNAGALMLRVVAMQRKSGDIRISRLLT